MSNQLMWKIIITNGKLPNVVFFFVIKDSILLKNINLTVIKNILVWLVLSQPYFYCDCPGCT